MISHRDAGRQFICLLIVLYVLYSESCEPWQVKRNIHCCIPVFNCQPGYEVTGCTKSGEQETCTECPEGTVQPDWINSFSANRTCFRGRQSCPAFDLTPTNKPRNECVPQYCKCNRNRCFYESTCVCYRADPCGVNETLNTATGGCEPCGPYEYKKVSGCGPCLVNVTAWMASKGILDIKTELPIYSTVTRHPQPEELETSSTTKHPSPQNTQTDRGLYFTLASKGNLDIKTELPIYSTVTNHPQPEESKTSSTTKHPGPQNTQTDRGIYFTLTIAFVIVSITILVISVLVCIVLCRKIRNLQNSLNQRQQNHEEGVPLQNHQVNQENST